MIFVKAKLNLCGLSRRYRVIKIDELPD